jgi:hypothetical protein
MAATGGLGRGGRQVGLGRVNLGGVSEAMIQKDMLNGANPSPDVEDGRMGREGALLHGVEELSSGRIRAPPEEPPQVTLGDTWIELLLGRTAVARGHGRYGPDRMNRFSKNGKT